ncbi:MAG: hypothetical protein WB975_06925 [Nitrososphaeraceae archaeon]
MFSSCSATGELIFFYIVFMLLDPQFLPAAIHFDPLFGVRACATEMIELVKIQ